MSRNACLAIVALAIFALAACSRPPMPSERTNPQSTSRSTATLGETLAEMIALDQQAIARAEQARAREGLDAPVAELAETIYMQHRRNLTQTRALGDAEAVDVMDSPALRNQRAEEATRLEALGEVDADAYPRAYLQAVVESHQQALDMIDGYTKSASNEAFRKHLERTRGNFAEHLETARTLLDG